MSLRHCGICIEIFQHINTQGVSVFNASITGSDSRSDTETEMSLRRAICIENFQHIIIQGVSGLNANIAGSVSRGNTETEISFRYCAICSFHFFINSLIYAM